VQRLADNREDLAPRRADQLRDRGVAPAAIPEQRSHAPRGVDQCRWAFAEYREGTRPNERRRHEPQAVPAEFLRHVHLQVDEKTLLSQGYERLEVGKECDEPPLCQHPGAIENVPLEQVQQARP
jgi:hypothetical protein